MKSTNLHCAREMAYGIWISGADPIERPQHRQVSPRAVWLGLIGALCIVAAMLAVGV